jgi:hypothetical protein
MPEKYVQLYYHRNKLKQPYYSQMIPTTSKRPFHAHARFANLCGCSESVLHLLNMLWNFFINFLIQQCRHTHTQTHNARTHSLSPSLKEGKFARTHSKIECHQTQAYKQNVYQGTHTHTHTHTDTHTQSEYLRLTYLYTHWHNLNLCHT